MSKVKPTGKSYLYIDRNGGLALDMAGFLLDPEVQERIKKLDDIGKEAIGGRREKTGSASKSQKKAGKRSQSSARSR